MTIVRRVLGMFLLLAGLVVAGVCAVALTRPALFQPATPRLPSVRLPGADAVMPRAGQPIGIIEVPRLGISSVVLEGEAPTALLLGVGHLADTPFPWDGGNSVLAAHRDTFFRPLEHIRLDDVIRFSTADAEFEYTVRETRIVEPTDLEVLEPTSASSVTLITCYPFTHVGPAPQRFIVRAELRETAG